MSMRSTGFFVPTSIPDSVTFATQDVSITGVTFAISGSVSVDFTPGTANVAGVLFSIAEGDAVLFTAGTTNVAGVSFVADSLNPVHIRSMFFLF